MIHSSFQDLNIS